jgi:hypothetical protein
MPCNYLITFSRVNMSFLNSIGDWFQTTFLKMTFDPAGDVLKQVYRATFQNNLLGLQSTIGGIGGGLGNFITSVPGISEATRSAYSALNKASEDALEASKSMTPAQIAAKNDELKAEHNRIAEQANKEALAAAEAAEAEKRTPIEELGKFRVDRFFKKVFENATYIIIFFVVLFLAFLGSSLAANAAIYKPIPFRIYYMVYGFILFPVAIGFGIKHFFEKKQLFYAFWAPLHKGFTSNPLLNLVLLPFIYSAQSEQTVSNFTGRSLVTSIEA